jgi:hypothetical protein
MFVHDLYLQNIIRSVDVYQNDYVCVIKLCTVRQALLSSMQNWFNIPTVQ